MPRSDAGDVFVEVDVLGRDRHPVRHYAAGRVCAHPGCGAILSIYNADDECSLHHRDFSTDGAMRGPRRHGYGASHTSRTSRRPVTSASANAA